MPPRARNDWIQFRIAYSKLETNWSSLILPHLATGKSKFHVDLNEIFANLKVWFASTENETHAIWYANVNGSHWVKQIVRNCNEAVKKGKGEADIVKRITFDLYDHEMSYSSQTITEYLKTFKAIVSDNRTSNC